MVEMIVMINLIKRIIRGGFTLVIQLILFSNGSMEIIDGGRGLFAVIEKFIVFL